MSWRTITDVAKRSEWALRMADVMGRGKGRARILDRVYAPPPASHHPDLTDWNIRALAAVWIGHATVLLRVGETTILTDPVFSNRIGIGLGVATAGPLRHIAPALSIKQLPPIDLILSSHAHFDHLDRPTLVKLSKSIQVIAAHRTGDLIADLGFKHITELRWGESCEVGSLKIIAQKVKHWGARTFYDRHRSFNAYVIESGRHRVLFGGDSAFQDYFKELKKIHLAILGIAAYDPFIAAHATPEQVWEMAGHARADFILPMHHSTFKLSHEPMHEPMERLLRAAGSCVDRIVLREVGQAWLPSI